LSNSAKAEVRVPTARVRTVAVIGGGPAGLMAAEVLSAAAVRVDVYDAMPSVGRKFLLAGRGGLNLTHTEPAAAFLSRYGNRQQIVARWLAEFGAEQLRAWTHDLGNETFVGSSGRVFPNEMKAAPLLRAWLHRLRAAGVRFHPRHRWTGWSESREGEQMLRFSTPGGELSIRPDAVVLALGGGSWARLGSDGAWVPFLTGRGVTIASLRPANCGFNVAWSDYWRDHLQARHAGSPVKSVVASCTASDGSIIARQGEFVVTEQGVEGGLIYALAAPLRDAIDATGSATLTLDLVPGVPLKKLVAELSRGRGRDSLSNHLRRRAGLEGIKAALLRELSAVAALNDPLHLATAIKALPLRLSSPRPLDEAISSAGGVEFDGLNDALMLNAVPGVFCAGEMLDWEAPTGGYLLTACCASGRAAGRGVLGWLEHKTNWSE